MKQYQELENGHLQIDGMHIPKSGGNRHYRQALAEVEASEAEILPYVEPVPTPEERRLVLKAARDAALAAITHDLGGGRIMQVRPIDASNIQLAIQQGRAREWVMEDNSVHVVTIAELQAALSSGIAQAEVIWSSYMADLKTL